VLMSRLNIHLEILFTTSFFPTAMIWITCYCHSYSVCNECSVITWESLDINWTQAMTQTYIYQIAASLDCSVR
jgi:hypothetical protein